ncbi:MAG: hypothetical protein JRG71_01845 [Deltaproteobacteria bacterium]|nr:hypothetical protein [Deltaproteobacteria bacterium]
MTYTRKIFVARAARGELEIRPEVANTLDQICKNLGVGSFPKIESKLNQYSLQESMHIKFWFLTHHLCLCGANIETLHPSLEEGEMAQCLGPSYTIFLPDGDSINKFCSRLLERSPFTSSLFTMDMKFLN